MATTWSTARSNIMSLALKCRDSIVSAGVLLLLDALKWRHWNGAMVLFDSSALDGEDLLGLRMGDSMLIDEVLWDAWFNVDRWRFVRWVSLFFCPSRAVIYACASHLRIRNGRARTLRTWHTWRNIIFSKRNVESPHGTIHRASVLCAWFSVLNKNSSYVAMLWMERQSYRTKQMEDQAELAPCRGSAPLSILHACDSRAHCMLRSSLSWAPDPKKSAFSNMKIKESLKMLVFLWKNQGKMYFNTL